MHFLNASLFFFFVLLFNFVEMLFQRIYYTYILKCNDESYYVGVTNNVKRRLIEHNQGLNKDCYTFGRRPVQLAYYESFKYILNAIHREKELKGWSRAKKEALIAGDKLRIKELSRGK